MTQWLKNIFNIGSTETDLDSKLGQRLVLRSVAEDGKAGALIFVSDQPVYIQGLDRWDESLLGHKVKVEGTLRKDIIYPQVDSDDGVPMQGMSGAVFYLEDYKLLK